MRRSTARPAAPSRDARSAEMLVALGVAGLTCMIFLPALGGGFLPWDDEANLVVNRAWRGLGPSQLGWMLTSFHRGHWIPVTWLSFALDHVVWGMDPRGYHLTNVLVHGANAGLVCLLAMRLLEAGRGTERAARRALGILLPGVPARLPSSGSGGAGPAEPLVLARPRRLRPVARVQVHGREPALGAPHPGHVSARARAGRDRK